MNSDQSAKIDERTKAIKANLKAITGKDIADLTESFTRIGLDPKTPDRSPEEAQAIARGVLASGFGYVDDRCTFFFGELLKVQRDSHFWTTEAALLGAAAGAIIAIAGPGIQAAGLAAAATAAAVGTSENVASDLLFDLDAGTTFDLNNKYRSAYKEKANTLLSTVPNYATAYTVISNYASLCTPVAIEAQVKAELRNAKPEAKEPKEQSELDKLHQQEITAVLKSVAVKTGMEDGLTLDQANMLYLLFVADDGKNALDPKITGGIHTKLAAAAAKNDQAIFDASDPNNVKVKLDVTNQAQMKTGLGILAAIEPDIIGNAAKLKTELLGEAPAAAVPAVAPAAPTPGAATPALPETTPGTKAAAPLDVPSGDATSILIGPAQ